MFVMVCDGGHAAGLNSDRGLRFDVRFLSIIPPFPRLALRKKRGADSGEARRGVTRRDAQRGVTAPTR